MIAVWWNAARPGSLVKVLLPLGAGLAMGAASAGELRLLYVAAALLFGWLDQLLIIFLNDYADADADTLHTRRFGELIDRRAVPHGWLGRRALLLAGAGVLLLMLLLTVGLALWYQRAWAPLFAAGAAAMLWAYSFPPVRLNYRGAGELLETAGVGGVLPWAGYYFYTGSLELPLWPVAPLLLLALASALSSGIKHMPADRVTGKKTASVLLGSGIVRLGILASTALALICCVALTLAGVYHWASLPLTVAAPLWFLVTVLRYTGDADHQHLRSLKIYKGALHRAIYATTLGVILSFLMLYHQAGTPGCPG